MLDLQPLSRIHQELIKFKLFVGQALNILQTLALPCTRRDRCRDLYALSSHDGSIGHGGTLVRNNLSVAAAHGRLLICTSDLHCRNVILKVTSFIRMFRHASGYSFIISGELSSLIQSLKSDAWIEVHAYLEQMNTNVNMLVMRDD